MWPHACSSYFPAPALHVSPHFFLAHKHNGPLAKEKRRNRKKNVTMMYPPPFVLWTVAEAFSPVSIPFFLQIPLLSPPDRLLSALFPLFLFRSELPPTCSSSSVFPRPVAATLSPTHKKGQTVQARLPPFPLQIGGGGPYPSPFSHLRPPKTRNGIGIPPSPLPSRLSPLRRSSPPPQALAEQSKQTNRQGYTWEKLRDKGGELLGKRAATNEPPERS